MADGYKARTLKELQTHFNLKKVTGYFLDGKLHEWLVTRYYDAEADALQSLDKTATDFSRKLCAVLGVTYEKIEYDTVDLTAVARLNEKRAFLQQRTDDSHILAHVAQTALTQEDLIQLLDGGIRELYLCGNIFTIPIQIGQCHYIGVLGKPKVQINVQSIEELANNGIVLEHVLLPEELCEIKNHKLRQSYQVSKLLENRMSDKDREIASKMYDATQDILESIIFDIDIGTIPLLNVAQKILTVISFDIDISTKPLLNTAKEILTEISFDIDTDFRISKKYNV